LIDHGLKAENIIVMAYDDIAHHVSNPFPGSMYNQPGDNPRDVNVGCVKDYTKRDVTPANFMAILLGDKTKVSGGNGRVLESGPDDYVFVNFVDHGGVGIPSEYMYANDLNATLAAMHTGGKFKKLVFYLESCDSGSMFDGLLPSDISIYATTAAGDEESSWGTYCPPDDVVKGVDLETCLGDLYSINWM
jgi:legumain